MYKNVLAVYKNGKCIIKSKRIDATITKMMTQCIFSIVNAQNKMFMLWQKNMRVIKQTHLELHSFMIPFIYCELFKFAFIKTSSCPNQQLVNNYQSQMYPVVNHIHINSYRKIRTTNNNISIFILYVMPVVLRTQNRKAEKSSSISDKLKISKICITMLSATQHILQQ